MVFVKVGKRASLLSSVFHHLSSDEEHLAGDRVSHHLSSVFLSPAQVFLIACQVMKVYFHESHHEVIEE